MSVAVQHTFLHDCHNDATFAMKLAIREADPLQLPMVVRQAERCIFRSLVQVLPEPRLDVVDHHLVEPRQTVTVRSTEDTNSLPPDLGQVDVWPPHGRRQTQRLPQHFFTHFGAEMTPPTAGTASSTPGVYSANFFQYNLDTGRGIVQILR